MRMHTFFPELLSTGRRVKYYTWNNLGGEYYAGNSLGEKRVHVPQFFKKEEEQGHGWGMLIEVS